MAFPVGLQTKEVSFGQAVVLESGAPLAMRVSVKASRQLVHRPSGQPLVSVETLFSSAGAGDGVLELPVCDSPDIGFGDGRAVDLSGGKVTHTYTAKIRYLDPDTMTVLPGLDRTIQNFVILSEMPGRVDLDDLLVNTPVGGTPISFSDFWSEKLNQSAELVQEAKDAAQTAETALADVPALVGSELSRPGSPAQTALNAAIETGVRAGALAAVIDATMEPVGELALEPAPLHANFLPTSVGIDGCVYGAIGAMYLGRTNDASTAHQAGQDFSVYPEHAGPSGAILWATRTEAGYVVVTGKTTNTYVWFSPTFTGGFTKTLEIPFIGATRLGIPNPQRTLDGKTVLVVSIWAGGSTPSKPAYASFDGGQTWKHLRDTPPFTAGGSNSHWHAAAYHKWTDRLWLSGGDGVNSYFGYTEDRGDTWVDCKTPPGSPVHDGSGGVSIDYQQPTIVIPFRDRIALGPDRGSLPPGMWTMDPVTATAVPHFTLDATVATADRQYPLYPYAQRGTEVYVSYPTSTSMPTATRTHTDIVATGDGGRSWHRVLRIPWSGTNAEAEGIWGIAGPDKNGWMYLRTITGIKRARTLEWVPSTPEYY